MTLEERLARRQPLVTEPMDRDPSVAGHGPALCGARKKDGGTCGRPAGAGTGHKGVGACYMHLGRTENHEKAGRKMLAEREAARSLADFGYERVADPLDALADLASRAVALSQHFADRVGELGAYRYESDIGTEQLRSELLLLEKFMSMAQKFLADWVRLGFEERKVRLDEARADLVRLFAVGVLVELGHELEDPAVRGAVERWLPVLDGAPAPLLIEATSTEVTDPGQEAIDDDH